jgi:predicted PurR-regulated permease PerM
MAFLDRKTLNVLLTILLFASVLVILYMARSVLTIFCFAILFAYLLDPVVGFLDRHSLLRRKARGVHIAEAYLGVLVLIAGSVYVLIPQASSRPGVFLRNVASFSDRLGSGEIATEVGQTNGWSEEQTFRAKEFLTSHRETIRKVSSQIQSLAAMILGAVAVMPILAIFFLADGRRLADMALAAFATEENLDRLQSLSSELNGVLRHYIRAKMTLVGLSFTYVSLSLFVLRYPHALALGILAGVLEFIPMVGSITAATTVIVFGFVTHSHWIWMGALLAIWRILIDYWIVPRVLGRELELHPVLAIFTLMVGAAVGGFAGVYLALPIAAIIRVAWRRFGNSRDQERHVLPAVATVQGQAAASSRCINQDGLRARAGFTATV